MNLIRQTILITCGLLVGASGVLWTGCEETLSGTEVEIPYREELVVQGFLTAGEATDTIVIMRTLHPLQKWSIEEAAITDADAVITSEGVEYRLKHIGFGGYVTENMPPQIGKSYHLRVDWKTLHVEGTATIPRSPEILSISFDTINNGCSYYYGPDEQESVDRFRILAEYVPHGANLSSGRTEISYSYSGGTFREGSWGNFFSKTDSSGGTHKVEVYERCLFDEREYNYYDRIDTIFLTMTEYESAFTDYFNTRYNGSDDDLFFGSDGGQPVWNIKGDGFGWFFGRAMGEDTFVMR